MFFSGPSSLEPTGTLPIYNLLVDQLGDPLDLDTFDDAPHLEKLAAQPRRFSRS
jgi:hypothetical protein